MGTNVESPMDDMAKQNQTIFSETAENEKIVDNEEILENDEEMDLYLARYLAASGKTEEELNVIDRCCLKIVYFTKACYTWRKHLYSVKNTIPCVYSHTLNLLYRTTYV